MPPGDAPPEVAVDGAGAERAVETLVAPSVAAVEQLERGTNAVFRARLAPPDGRTVLLKADARGVGERFLVEPATLRQVAGRTSVPVPAVLASADADGPLDVPCFVMERLPGEHRTLGSLDETALRRLCREAGRHLGDLHAEVGFEAFGPLVLDGDDLAVAGDYDGWPAVLRATAERNLELLGRTRFEPWVESLRDELGALVAAVERHGPYRPVAVHNDVRPGNLLVDPDGGEPLVTGVIDWGAGLAAHGEFDLVMAESLLLDRAGRPGDRDRLRRALYDGYRATGALAADGAFERRRRTYRFVAAVRMLRNVRGVVDDAGGASPAAQTALLRGGAGAPRGPASTGRRVVTPPTPPAPSAPRGGAGPAGRGTPPRRRR